MKSNKKMKKGRRMEEKGGWTNDLRGEEDGRVNKEKEEEEKQNWNSRIRVEVAISGTSRKGNKNEEGEETRH